MPGDGAGSVSRKAAGVRASLGQAVFNDSRIVVRIGFAARHSRKHSQEHNCIKIDSQPFPAFGRKAGFPGSFLLEN